MRSPSFLAWSFGEHRFASPVEAASCELSVSFAEPVRPGAYSFRGEFQRVCESIDRDRKGRTVALSYDGGLFAELMARELKRLSIPFELYFLEFLGLNGEAFERAVAPLAAELGVQAHRFALSREDFRVAAAAWFERLGLEFPLYLGLWWLFEQIPQDRYIVTGDGATEREGELVEHIASRRAVPGHYRVPCVFPASQIAHYLWAEASRREGCFYPFFSDARLLAALITHPKFEASYPRNSCREVVYEEFPGLRRRERESAWKGALRENRLLRNEMRFRALTSLHMPYWQGSAGTVVDLSSIFLE